MAGVLLNAVAQLALKAGTNRVGEFAFALDNVVPIGLKLITNPFIAGGLACYVVSVVVWIMALSRVPVSIAYPMPPVGYILNPVAPCLPFGESPTAQKPRGIGFIVMVVFLVARAWRRGVPALRAADDRRSGGRRGRRPAARALDRHRAARGGLRGGARRTLRRANGARADLGPRRDAGGARDPPHPPRRRGYRPRAKILRDPPPWRAGPPDRRVR